ncbi:MAG TPA: hypothetical protein VHZ26_17925 [Caulobacteraceae bacterium]|jgi:hypothetical protein|nr:hypothetical protein [Caulobacteraceae bacterium]
MITGLNLARLAKLIALLGFVFPWVLVSCAGQPVGRLTGIDLATGNQLGRPDLWVVLSLAAVVLGLVVSFLLTGRRAIVAMAAAAIVALAASVVGVSDIGVTAQSAGAAPVERPVNAVGQVDLQYGYIITVAGLLTALAACGAALARRGSNTAPP